MKAVREKRLDSEFKKYVYDILKNDVKNPDLDVFFSIVDVKTTQDLKEAKVYVSFFGTTEEKIEKAFTAMKNSAQTVRKEISRQMHIRTVPEFKFFIDKSEEYGNKIDKILEEINKGNN